MNTFELDGRHFIAQPSDGTCHDCAGHETESEVLCTDLPACTRRYRPDGHEVIWVEDAATLDVGENRLVRGDSESIKTLQTKLLRLEKLERITRDSRSVDETV